MMGRHPLGVHLLADYMGILAGHLVRHNTAGIGQNARLQTTITLVQADNRLGGQYQRTAVLSDFRQHALPIGAGHGLELIAEKGTALPLAGGNGFLVTQRRLHQADHSATHQRSRLNADGALRGGNEKDQSLFQYVRQKKGGLPLSHDDGRPKVRLISANPAVNRPHGITLGLAAPIQKGAEPADKRRILNALDNLALEGRKLGILRSPGGRVHPVIQKPENIHHSKVAIPRGVRVRVVLVHHEEAPLEQVLQTVAPCFPQVAQGGNDGINAAVAVSKELRVQEVNPRYPVETAEIKQADLGNQLRGHRQKNILDQVRVGIDNHYGRIIETLSLAMQLITQDMLHHRGLTHTRTAENKGVLPQRRLGEKYGRIKGDPRITHMRTRTIGAMNQVTKVGNKLNRGATLHRSHLIATQRRMP